MSLEQRPKTNPISFQYETVYGTQLLQLAEKLQAKRSKWTLILGDPAQVVLSNGGSALAEKVNDDFELPMTHMSADMLKIPEVPINGGD